MKIPTLDECKSDLIPTGFNLIIAMPAIEKTTAGGLHLPDEIVERNRYNQVRGRIVAMSPAAFDFANFPPENIPKVGDAVLIARHSGTMNEGVDGRDYRVVLDKDICAIVKETGND